jgi:cholesterol transport system auxiliary component
MRRRRTMLGLAWAAATLTLAACALTDTQRLPPMTTYALQWDGGPPPARQAEKAGCRTLALTTPRAAPGFGTTRMAYAREPYRIDYFANSEWAGTPADMLRPLLRRALEQSGMFHAVVGPSAPLRADSRLDSEILQLQQLFSQDAGAVRFALRVELYDLANARSLGSRVLTASEPTPGDNPHGGVVAANRAVGRVLGELPDLLRQWLRVGGNCKFSP